MSDFWEKNKGSITSGLKTAGKYGYQGTKYVAKTGYKAGKKSFNNPKTNNMGKKKKGGQSDDEEEEEAEEEAGRSGRNRRDNSMQYPPSGYQGYPPPMQTWQQPPQNGYAMQQPPPQWQQPPQAWQQPQQQWQQFQQPQQPQQYQQFQQFQQPPPPQQPQQYQQYQNYQQPPQQLPQQPQSQPFQQPTQPAYPSSQPSQQPAEQQQPYGYLNQPSSGIPSASSSQHQLGPPPLQQPIAQNPVPAYNNSQPLSASQAQLQYNDPQQITQASTLEAQVHQQSLSGPAYSRPGMASPPLPGRNTSNHSMPSTVNGNLPNVTESPVLGVTPFDYENAEENRSASRIRLPQIDLTNLPPPPTHRDRGTPELKTSEADSKGSLPQNRAHPVPSAGEVVKQSPPPEISHGQIEPLKKIPSLSDENTKETISGQIETPAEDIPPPTENAVGISGKFNYEVKLDYAPPPKPHRVLQQPSMPKSATRSNQVRPVARPEISAAGSAPPACPKRRTMDPVLNTGESNSAPLSNFQAPPKPFRHPESSASRETERRIHGPSHADIPPLKDNSHGQPPLARDVSSFPPPPKPLRSTTRLEDPSAPISETQYDGNTPPPTPRGRLTTSLTTERNSTSSDIGDSRQSNLAKKSAPPVVKSKPKNLSVGNSDDNIHTRTVKKEHSQQQSTSEIGDISDELAKFKLRKTGSSFVEQKSDNENEINAIEEKRPRPPMIPRKKDSLKNIPPVPIKSSSLRSVTDNKNRTASSEESNPFEHYLKSAVPFENDRLHR